MTEQSGSLANRYDVTILVNGLPLVQVELKKRGVAIREAFNQDKGALIDDVRRVIRPSLGNLAKESLLVETSVGSRRIPLFPSGVTC